MKQTANNTTFLCSSALDWYLRGTTECPFITKIINFNVLIGLTYAVLIFYLNSKASRAKQSKVDVGACPSDIKQ